MKPREVKLNASRTSNTEIPVTPSPRPSACRWAIVCLLVGALVAAPVLVMNGVWVPHFGTFDADNSHIHGSQQRGSTAGSKGGDELAGQLGLDILVEPADSNLGMDSNDDLSDGERLRRLEGIHANKKLPMVKDIKFLEPILGVAAAGTYPQAGALRTFDQMIAESMSPEHYVHSLPLTPESRPLAPCDPSVAPFADAKAHATCTLFLKSVFGAAFYAAQKNGYLSFEDEFEIVLADRFRWVLRTDEAIENHNVSSDDDGLEERANVFVVSFEPLLPKFEQRTIKFKAEVWNKARTAVISAVLKVPQMLFPREPFSEIVAHRLDRLLGINRIPPIALFEASVEVLKNITLHRRVQKVHMDKEFLEESRVGSYDEWIDKDLYNFVIKNKGINFVGNTSHVWITAQLFLNEVRPLLDTQLMVPYSRQRPGWHRWYIVGYNETEINNASLLALSELAIFDFITMNDDRSPNKNNFAIGGCKRCDKRRPSGMVPTVLHLDQGMSMFGSGHILSHSPLGKQRDKVKFCIFYKPVMAAIYQRLVADGDDIEVTRRWLLRNTHPAALKALGKGSVGEVAEQLWRVLRRLLVCMKENGHTADEVLRPNTVFWN